MPSLVHYHQLRRNIVQLLLSSHDLLKQQYGAIDTNTCETSNRREEIFLGAESVLVELSKQLRLSRLSCVDFLHKIILQQFSFYLVDGNLIFFARLEILSSNCVEQWMFTYEQSNRLESRKSLAPTRFSTLNVLDFNETWLRRFCSK